MSAPRPWIDPAQAAAVAAIAAPSDEDRMATAAAWLRATATVRAARGEPTVALSPAYAAEIAGMLERAVAELHRLNTRHTHSEGAP